MSQRLKQAGADARLPLYLQLRDQLAAQISAGIWQPGQCIPSENELRQTYQIAIGTIRRAIETLVAEGLVERTHGKGTFVRKARFDKSLFSYFQFESTHDQRTMSRSLIVSRKTVSAPARVAAALQLKPRGKVIELLRLRMIDDHPVLAENIYLCAQRFKSLTRGDTEDFGDFLYPLYERTCGQIVASAKETLTVESVTAAQGELLELEENAPVVVIERLALAANGKPLEWRQSRGAAAKFLFSASVR